MIVLSTAPEQDQRLLVRLYCSGAQLCLHNPEIVSFPTSTILFYVTIIPFVHIGTAKIDAREFLLGRSYVDLCSGPGITNPPPYYAYLDFSGAFFKRNSANIGVK